MKARLTLSANAGLCVEFGGKCVWIDALHEGSASGFSGVSEQLLERIFQGGFAAPDVIAFTHRHKDHYNAKMLEKAHERYPHAQILPLDQPQEFSLRGLKICFVPLVHSGKKYEDFIHHGILLSAEGKTLLIAGDCRVTEDTLAGLKPDLAVLTFPWLTLPRGREFVADRMQPKQVIYYHLPFAADDINGYRALAQAAADAYGAALLSEPLQSVTFEL